jgi:hypothetical protein
MSSHVLKRRSLASKFCELISIDIMNAELNSLTKLLGPPCRRTSRQTTKDGCIWRDGRETSVGPKQLELYLTLADAHALIGQR